MRRLPILILAAYLLTPLTAQQEAVFRSQSNLVIVNVIIRDRAGKPVEGLNKEDFTVAENGKLQTISVFEFQRLSLDLAPIGTALPNSAAPPPAAARQGSQRFRDRRLLVLFFDFAAMEIPDQLRAQEAAKKFISEKLTASDLVSIMSFSSTLRTDQEFTDDRTKLLAAVNKFTIGQGLLPGSEPVLASETEGDDATQAVDDAEQDLFNTDRKLGALESAAKALAALPEKKALVYFSSGAGGGGAENQAQLRATINAAVRSNVAFYPIDVRGLLAIPPGGSASETGARGTAVFTGQAQRSHRDKLNSQQDTLFALASDTGGKALIDNNDLAFGIQQAQKDLQSYYTIGYYSTDGARDGRFRQVSLKLNPGIQAKLDFRQGYYGEKDWKSFNSSDKERQLQDALLLGDPQTDLPIALEINWFRLNPTKFFIPVALKLPGSAISAERKSTEFDFIGNVRDQKGKVVGSVRDGIKIPLPGNATAQDLKKRSVIYDTGFTLPPGEYQAKFLVRENFSGKMGTFETKFVIPDQPAISSVVWSNLREPMNSAVASVEKNRKVLANHPLIRDGQKLIPSVTKLFRSSQKMYVYVEAYDSKSSPSATVSLFLGKVKVMESEPVHASDSDPARVGTASLQFQIPLEGVRPGRYIAQISIVDAIGRKFSYDRTAMVIAR